MAKKIFSAAVTGALVSNDSILLRSVLLTAEGGNCHCIIKGNGVDEIKVSCPANSSTEYGSISGGNQFSLEPIPGPVTIDIVGTNPFVRVSF